MSSFVLERSTEQLSEIARARAAQEAIFATAKAEVAQEFEAKQQKFTEALRTRAIDDNTTLLAEQNAIIERIRQELRAEGEKRNGNQTERVRRISTDEGDFWTLLGLNGQLQDDWLEAEFHLKQPDEIVSVEKDRLAVERGGSYFQLEVCRLEEGRFFIKLIDHDEHPMTKLRLRGVLQPLAYEDGERLAYKQDEDARIHPSVNGLLESNLRQLMTVIKEGTVIPRSYPEE